MKGHSRSVPGWINLVSDALSLSNEHVGDQRIEQLAEVSLAVDLEAVRHDLAGQAVSSEQSLHGVRDLHLWGKIKQRNCSFTVGR